MRTFTFAALALAALVSGIVLPLQAGVNNGLRQVLGHPLRASLASFVVGTVVLGLATAFVRSPWPALPDALRAPGWVWTGGILGAWYIFSVIVLVPRLGAGVTFALIVAGQMLCSLTIDHFGLLGLPRTPVGATRMLGAGLLVAGVLLVRT